MEDRSEPCLLASASPNLSWQLWGRSLHFCLSPSYSIPPATRALPQEDLLYAQGKETGATGQALQEPDVAFCDLPWEMQTGVTCPSSAHTHP